METGKGKHTPGKWVAECVGSGWPLDNPDDVYEVNNGYKRIAEYVSEADARLIAAAPELLAALLDMVHYDDLPAAEQQPAVERARSAISKAKGEA